MHVLKEVGSSPLDGIRVVVLDVDNTLFISEEYCGEGRGKELAVLARRLCLSVDRANARIEETRAQLARDHGGRRATLTEVVESFRFPLSWWNKAREECYRPEKWLRPNPMVTAVVRTLAAEFLLVAASNSPRTVMHRVLGTVALRKFFRITWAPEDGGAKHDPDYWRKLAERLGVSPSQCVSVGDRVEADCDPAIDAGFGGAILVVGAADLPEVARYLMARK